MRRHSIDPAADPLVHSVQLYDDDLVLIGSLQQFLASGLSVGEACVVIATPEHTAAIIEALEHAGFDMPALTSAGQFIAFDARRMMAVFATDGVVDPQQFDDTVGAVLERASRDGRDVRAFGEMVALLWADGDVAAAIEVESLWNALGSRHDFSLLCAYPVDSFADPAFAAPFRQVCAKHTHVLPAATQGSLSLPAELTSGAQARTYLRETLPPMGCLHVLEDAVLLLTELVNNAVVHAGSGAEVRLQRSPQSLFVEVRDGGIGGALRRDAGADEVGGRGLALLESLASEWDAGLDEAGAHRVWFQLDLTV